MDYNLTLNLPQTGFPMRAGLPKREPVMLADWQSRGLYNKLMERRKDRPLFILHDGPPFSNGDIHMGHALNKILKDFVLRYKNMAGMRAPYVPGWDNHGMPIESAIIKKNKLDRSKMSIPEFRDACRDFAQSFVERQSGQFQRLGILGDWDNPYLTMDKEFEADELLIFAEMAEKGYIYKGLRPVYWCSRDGTALAEAEIEYQDQECDSIYVKFPVADDKGVLAPFGDVLKMSFVIWTTTTWTLPGNLAVCLNPEFDYVLCQNGDEILIVAEALKESVEKDAALPSMPVLGRVKGRALEYAAARHPLYDRDSLVITGGHVTAEAGTGCVHTAPGHGAEDYFVSRQYKLPILVPVDGRGVMTADAGPYEGLAVSEANKVIAEDLRAKGALLALKTIVHPYPHCWRCKHPILFRATEQWFASVDAIKDKACAEAEKVRYIPEWGRDRMISMVRERADWCISRQRHWGLPIPVFNCGDCGKPVLTRESVESVSEHFRREGSNAWYRLEAKALLPDGFVCPRCGGDDFTKETSTLDGWFDSGTTHHGVLLRRADHRRPADLYLEGGDQYRGWYQSSLLTAVAAADQAAPFKTVVTNGWVTDREGHKMSKSAGNGLDPMGICEAYGADILRLWVSSVDYRSDVFFTQDTFKQLSDIYLKIRNTCRFLLGNLSDYDPDCPAPDLTELDEWALWRLDTLVKKVLEGYEKYEYHMIFHAVHNFCVIDMSSFYLDIIKDRLYCEYKTDPLRRAAQFTLYTVLDTLVRLTAPVLAFTSEEIWSFMPHCRGAETESVLFNDMPSPSGRPFAHAAKWERLGALRLEVNKALEEARAAKTIGKSLEAAVTLTADGEELAFWQSCETLLPEIFIVSKVILNRGERAAAVAAAPGGKCARCWGFFEDLGTDKEHPALCPRCTRVVLKTL